MKCLDDERIEDNRCHISSLFLIWVGEIDFNTYKYTLVFGHVIDGLKKLVVSFNESRAFSPMLKRLVGEKITGNTTKSA